MANKIIDFDWGETGINAYLILERKSDNYQMNASQVFEASPASYPAMPESGSIGGRYSYTVTEALADGKYVATIKKRAGGSQAPTTDQSIGSGEMYIKDDAETGLDVLPSTRLATSAYTAPDNVGIAALPTLGEIEASTVLAKEATLSRLLGLALENHVEDDIVRDVSGNKTSSALYCYDSAAAVGTHVSGGGPGLVAKYNVTAAYSNGKMTSFKVVKA